MKPGIIFLIVLIVFPSMICFSDSVDAIGAPQVHLMFEEGEEEQVADVQPGETSTVSFPGIVEVGRSPGGAVQDVVVTLMGSTELAWPVSIIPEMVQVDPGGSAKFVATVSVPIECSFYIQDVLTISGVARNFPGVGAYNVPPVTGSIRIAQFCMFTIHASEPKICTGPGSRVVYEMDIHNLGNGKDTFSVNINNLDELNNKGIKVNKNIYTAEVNEKSNYTFEIRVDVPSGGKASGKHTIEVQVASELAEKSGEVQSSMVYCLELEVEGGTILGVSYLSFGVIVIIIAVIVAAIVVVRRRKGISERTFTYNYRKKRPVGV